VAFPGGHKDDTDKDHIHTALREMEEETGWPSTEVNVLGLFHEVPSRHKVAVTPVIGYIGEVGGLERFKPNAREIDCMFTIPLSELSEPSMWVQEKLERGITPRFISPNRPDIWGLTGYYASLKNRVFYLLS